MNGAIRVEGVRELRSAFRGISRDLERSLVRELRDIGNIVRDDERAYLSGIGASRKSRSGIRTQVRGPEVAIEQRYSTVTGKRGDWGARIMSSLARARAKRRPEVMERLENLLDGLADRYGF